MCNVLAMRSTPKGIEYRYCVCPAWASGIEDTKLFHRAGVPEGERLCVPDPYARGSCPEALASYKLVCREAWSEGSETANPGSNEQDRVAGRLDTEAVQDWPSSTDEVAHHTDVQRMGNHQVLVQKIHWTLGEAYAAREI